MNSRTLGHAVRLTTIVSAAALATVAICVGCATDDVDPCRGAPGTALIDHHRWHPVAVGADPFSDRASDRPGLACDPTAVVVENDALEINTGGCPYVTLTQPALRGAARGATLSLLLWHQALQPPLGVTGPVSGHVAVAIDGAVVWERHVSIPTLGHTYQETVTVDAQFCLGAPIVVHVHNHGSNAWTVRTLAIDDATP